MPLLPGPYPIEGCKIARGDVVTLENVQIIWPNFSGAKGDMNAEGDRNFNIVLTQAQADDLAADGWSVKCKKPRPNDPDFEEQLERCVLKVTVNFDIKPPNIKMIGDRTRNKTLLTADLVGLLDQADIRTADLSFVPYFWEIKSTGAFGVSAYLKTMYVEIIEDPLDLKWADITADAS